jgi:hypothetical protein
MVDAKQQGLFDAILEKMLPLIRAAVKEGLDEGHRLSEIAVLLADQAGEIGTVPVLRKALTSSDGDYPELTRDVAAAMASTGDTVPVIVRLCLDDPRLQRALGGDTPERIRGLAWFDFKKSAVRAN